MSIENRLEALPINHKLRDEILLPITATYGPILTGATTAFLVYNVIPDNYPVLRGLSSLILGITNVLLPTYGIVSYIIRIDNN